MFDAAFSSFHLSRARCYRIFEHKITLKSQSSCLLDFNNKRLLIICNCDVKYTKSFKITISILFNRSEPVATICDDFKDK